MSIIQIENVTKEYTGHRALDDVSFVVPRGGVYGLLGPNGAGKTTLIRIINHITAPDSGRVMINGHQLAAADVTNIGYLPEERGLYKKMRVGEQAMFFARLKGMTRNDAQRELRHWFDRMDIGAWWNRKVEELSKGMAQKVQFIVTVVHKPELLIFDEPFSGFDPVNANMLKAEIMHLKDQGSTVIFSTHNMNSVEETCDNITLINRGRNVLTGNVAEIRRRHSDGRYTVTYTGDDSELQLKLRPLLKAVTRDAHPDGTISLDIRLSESTSLRDVISFVNEAVNLRSVNPHIASMNEIFINTVGHPVEEILS